jgi:oligopeptide transport system substrate-binding protein
MRKLLIPFSLLIALSMVFAACAPQPAAEPETVTVVETQIVEVEKVVEVEVEPEAPMGPKTLTWNLHQGDVPTLDPALSTDTSSVQVVYETHPGLIRQHEETNAIDPGMAESWEVVNNDDGTATYTFNLRNDIPWVRYDGFEVVQVTDEEGNVRMVTANDFEYGIKRMLDPATASDYAYVSVFALAGSADYNAGVEGASADDVMVKAVDDFTLEVTFNDQAVYNLAIAGMWLHSATPQWIIEERGDRWTEPGFHQSYGPYALKEWVHDSYLTITVNPFWPGTDAIPYPKIEEIYFYMLDDIPAFAEYEAGNLDASGVPLDDLDRVKADPVLSEELTINPVQCSYYYGFNTLKEHVSDVRVRRALSHAVDRQSLIDNVTKGGQEPAQWFSRPGLFGAPTMEDYYPDLGIGYDPAAAQAELQSYLDETGLAAADLDLTLMFNTSSGHQKIAEAIQQMWKDTLGVEVKLANQEWKVYLKTIQEDAPQIWRLGWCSDYAHANNFIKEVFGTGGHEESATNINSEEMDAILAQAAMEPDPAKAMELYAQAEQILVYDIAEIIPIYFYTGVSVTKPYVDRTYGVGGQQYFEKWDITK